MAKNRVYVRLRKSCQQVLTHLVRNRKPTEVIKMGSDLNRFVFMGS